MLKRITFRAENELIEKARARARREKTSLNKSFRKWLSEYVGRDTKSTDHFSLMESLGYAKSAQGFTRDELDER